MSVEIPISAPNPNSPPSAYCVDAFCKTIALSTSLKNLEQVSLFSVMIEAVWCEECFVICFIASSIPFTVLTDIILYDYNINSLTIQEKR